MPQDVNESIYSAKYFLITFWVISHWKQTVHVKKLRKSLRPWRLDGPISVIFLLLSREKARQVYFYFCLSILICQMPLLNWALKKTVKSSNHLSLDWLQNIGAERDLSGQLIRQGFIYWLGKLRVVKVTNFDMGRPAFVHSSVIKHWNRNKIISLFFTSI